jgi:hypothetical protein
VLANSVANPLAEGADFPLVQAATEGARLGALDTEARTGSITPGIVFRPFDLPVMRSRRRTSAAFRRSPPSGDRKETTAFSTVADFGSFLRAVKIVDLLQKPRREVDVCSLPHRRHSHPGAVVMVKRCLPGKTPHLPRADFGKQVPGEDTLRAVA